jgi:methionyl-tRNA formyltransferase
MASKDKLRIVYMGTPEFAVPSLEKLVANNYDVAAVITAPDKPRGRGQKLAISAVKETALKHQLRILQPTNLKDQDFINELAAIKANLQIVVAFRMLPEVVWNMPKYGTFNLHASLLPQYRGAAPINWAIINGESVTGCTTFFLKHKIDTGNIIFQEKEPIHPNDTAGSLYQRLMIKGGDLVVRTAEAIQHSNYSLVEQNVDDSLPQAPKIFKEDCAINWNQPPEKVYDFIRGLSPFPGAHSVLSGRYFKIFFGEPHHDGQGALPGTLVTDNKNYIHVRVDGGYLNLTEIQQEGKKRMKVKDYLIGNSL